MVVDAVGQQQLAAIVYFGEKPFPLCNWRDTSRFSRLTNRCMWCP
jgi:hypothetical protein